MDYSNCDTHMEIHAHLYIHVYIHVLIEIIGRVCTVIIQSLSIIIIVTNRLSNTPENVQSVPSDPPPLNLP